VSCAVIQAEPVSNWKGLSSGEAASRALHNTYLARTGITGTLGVFDGWSGRVAGAIDVTNVDVDAVTSGALAMRLTFYRRSVGES